MTASRWLNCRLCDLQDRLASAGHTISQPVISRLLRAHDYRLHLNVKGDEGKAHPQRNEQFEHILSQRQQHLAIGQPCLSVDTKKKELIGNFKNGGRTWGTGAEVVNVHDFPSQAAGRAVPYGIYDLCHNCAIVYVGQSADTPAFAVDNIARWCETELPLRFPDAHTLFIEADGGGSNGALGINREVEGHIRRIVVADDGAGLHRP
jgi:hypothetical protein